MRKHSTVGMISTVLLASVMAQPVQKPSMTTTDLQVLPRVTVTVLVENMAGGGNVLGEWGLSLLIETDQHQVVFDMGGGRTLLENVQTLEKNLGKTEAIVLSHKHGDHTGGLETTLNACKAVDFYIHPAAFDPFYYRGAAGAIAEIFPIKRQQLAQRVRKLVETKEPTSVFPGLMVTGQVPRVTEFENTGVRGAFLDEALTVPDPLLDDQAVFFRVPEGVVILLGCAHAGLVNTMAYVSQLTGESKVYAVLGGTHLVSASPERIQETVKALKQYDVQQIMLAHCTGVKAYAELAAALPGRCSWPAAGSTLVFGGK